MDRNGKKIIFLHSYSPRTGHNYSSEVIKVISDHVVLAHHRSETRLSRMINSFDEIQKKLIYHDSDREFFQFLFLDDLRSKILQRCDKKFALIKDTSFIGTDRLPSIFPNDIHIILLRDPKDVFASLFKAMDLTKRTRKNYVKRIGTSLGLYPYFYSRKVSNQVLQALPDLNSQLVLRYEDLVLKKEESLLKLIDLFDSQKNLSQVKKEIDQIPVINSSFYEEVGAKNIWDTKDRTSKFNPISRKRGNFFIRKGIEMGSKKLRRKLGYL